MSQKPLFHFEISERKLLLRLFDNLGVLLTLTLVGIIFRFDYFKIDFSNWNWVLVFLIYFNFFANIFELYDLQKAGRYDSVLKNVLLTTSLTVLFYILTPFFTPSLPENRLQIFFFFLSVAGYLLLWRYLYISLISSPRFYKRVLVVGDSFDIGSIAESLQRSDPNYVVVGFINTKKANAKQYIEGDIPQFSIKDLNKVIKENHINELVVASTYRKGIMLNLYNQLNDLLKKGFPIRDYTQVYEELTRRIPVQNIERDFYRYFPFSRSNQNKLYKVSHRIFDIMCSILGILIGVLLAPFIIVGNLIGNRGRFFYAQERVGKNGVVFKINKLRTMSKDAEITGPQYATKGDLRITPFGRFLRRTRLDEIPQFYNVLKGNMSIIGPRPERPVFVKELAETITFYDARHSIKPGLTGWAQVKADYGNSHGDSLEKLQYDLYYIKHRSLFLDLNILLKTLSTVIFYRGQ